MEDDEDAPPTLWERCAARSGWLLGVIGLIAWGALLWAMFGDVL